MPPPPDNFRIGIVTGMVSEAACLESSIRALPDKSRPQVFCSGGRADRAAEGLARMLAEAGDRKISGLLSFGLAGGLDPALSAGDLVVAETVTAPDGRRYETDAGWRTTVADAIAGERPVIVAGLAGADRVVATRAAKADLHRSTGAAAVDMESHVVAKAAREADLPFLAIRAVADPADRSIPSTALAGLAPDGRTRPFAVMARLVFKPWEISGLLRLARDSRAALVTLEHISSLLIH